jgi:hypothetical protein
LEVVVQQETPQVLAELLPLEVIAVQREALVDRLTQAHHNM